MTQNYLSIPMCIVPLLCLLLTVPSLCFVDECESLGKKGLRAQTNNITLDFSRVEPITDRFRFYRNVSDDGFVQYVSESGFRTVTIIGYAYDLDGMDTDWYFELRTGLSTKKETMSVLRLNSTNLQKFKEPWPMNVSTNWTSFKIRLGSLPRCPKVIELWFRGSASGNLFPGWGLQVGQVTLEESLFRSCKVPECLQSQPARCFESLSTSYSLRTIHDRATDFSQVFMASDNMDIAVDSAVANFNGDMDRFRRQSIDRGIVAYSIPDGIATIEITFYRCEENKTELSLTPYMDPMCKPLVLTPLLEDDSYYSNCWRRYKTSVDFSELLPCPPTYIDLVLDGDQPNSLQIANVVLTGFGPIIQDPEFKERVALRQKSSNSMQSPSKRVALKSDSNEGSDASVKIVHWLPPTIVAGFLVFAIVAGIILYRNDDVRDFIVDYVEDNCPFIYKHFCPPEPPKPTSPKPSPGGKHPSNNPWAASGSVSYSCTFDGNLKKTREPTPIRDVKAARDGLGEQLIDLSKHLQTKFWTSKVRRKQHVVEIEERLGKGGFGKIWKARWQGTVVALKVVPLHANLRQEEKQAKMAIMEAALSGCLAHPNIVSTYACEIREAENLDDENESISVEDTQNRVGWVSIDRFAGTNASKSFMKSQCKNDLEVRIIMEYCDRGSLVIAIKRGWFRKSEDPNRPDMVAIALTALDIARGLCCLHENDIIHGDLKPHNVLIQNKPFVDSRGFIAKIADFGLSIKMESEQSHVDGMRMGTGGYVSPEVAVHGKILPASDIYSYGILLWEMYTGELIQDAIKDAPKVSSRQTMGSWRPIFKPDCPQAYSRLACMCWNDFPDWRPTLDYIIDELNEMVKTTVPSMTTASHSVESLPDAPDLDSASRAVVIP